MNVERRGWRTVINKRVNTHKKKKENEGEHEGDASVHGFKLWNEKLQNGSQVSFNVPETKA